MGREWINSKVEWMDSKAEWTEWKMTIAKNYLSEKEVEERQKRFEEETRNNFADIKLHLENITDRNISILAENHLNLINKMDVSATWMNRIMINEVKMNALTDQVARLQAKSS